MLLVKFILNNLRLFIFNFTPKDIQIIITNNKMYFRKP